jgi:Putative adhesin
MQRSVSNIRNNEPKECTMQKFDTPAPIAAVLDVPAGHLRFIAAHRSDTTVEVLPANSSNRRDVKAAEQTTVVYGDGVLRIETQSAKSRLLGQSGAVEVTVQLPVGSRVEAKSAAAELRGVGRLGDVAFEGQQATVKVDEAANARLTTLAGDITIGRLTGNGEISTQKGDLRVDEAVRGKVTLRTEQGDILLTAARGVSASLDAGTTLGRILNSLKNTDGTSADLTVHATTAYGDITARSL